MATATCENIKSPAIISIRLIATIAKLHLIQNSMKVKKQGWINIYEYPKMDRSVCGVFESKEEAIEAAKITASIFSLITTIQIEWEEEE